MPVNSATLLHVVISLLATLMVEEACLWVLARLYWLVCWIVVEWIEMGQEDVDEVLAQDVLYQELQRFVRLPFTLCLLVLAGMQWGCTQGKRVVSWFFLPHSGRRFLHRCIAQARKTARREKGDVL